MNTNVGDMPLEIFGDYTSDTLDQDWTWEYLTPILNWTYLDLEHDYYASDHEFGGGEGYLINFDDITFFGIGNGYNGIFNRGYFGCGHDQRVIEAFGR